jgi:hypothetical protein
MLAMALISFLGAKATVSLALDASLKCPTLSSLSDRMGRVGLEVLVSNPQAPAVAALLAAPSFEVSIKPTAEGLLLTTRRTSDGKVFERPVQTGKEDCPTIERLVVVLIHSWITAKLPVLSPAALDGGAKR